MTSTPETIIGFDFGDSETAIAAVSASARAEVPQEIITTLGNTATGIIQTVVGFLHGGGAVIGSGAGHIPVTQLANLHVGFKTVPREEDQEYKKLSSLFLNGVGETLIGKGFVEPDKSRFIFGHPTRWKSIDGGKPVEVFRQMIAETCIGKGQFEVVPESRAALVQAIQSGLLSSERAKAGWVLVIDVGSSTTDFTAVDIRNRTSNPVDYGEEIGARLIDRMIAERSVAQSEFRDAIQTAITKNGSLKGYLELRAREVKEAYFSLSASSRVIEKTEAITEGGKKYYLTFSLNPEVLAEITTRVPIAYCGEKPRSWSAAFRDSLERVKQHLENENIDNLSAIVLTGGASRMDFVSYLCEEVFPEHAGNIVCSPKPSYDIAYGLARWGKLEVQTSAFMKEVDEFCNVRIPMVVGEKYTELVEALANAFQQYITTKIIDGLKKWKRGGYLTINGMQASINDSIVEGLKVEGEQIIKDVTEPWISDVIATLTDEVAPMEDKYGMRRGALGASFALDNSVLSSFGDMMPGASTDYTNGATDAIGSVVAVVSGIITFILAAYVYPIVAIIVIKIVAVISVTLATGLLTILATNPAGWAVLLAAGITGAILGKDVATQKLKEINLPIWVREKIVGEKVESEVRAKSLEIRSSLLENLKDSAELKATVEKGLANAMGKSLREKAEDARLLIN